MDTILELLQSPAAINFYFYVVNGLAAAFVPVLVPVIAVLKKNKNTVKELVEVIAERKEPTDEALRLATNGSLKLAEAVINQEIEKRRLTKGI